MKKVLLTGATGFIGIEVTKELLRRNFEVHAVVTRPVKNKIKNIIWHPLDLMKKEQVDAFFLTNQFENLLHLAWYTGPKCHSSVINLSWLSASINLMENFVKTGGKTFLGAGSVSEYDFSYGYLIEDKTPLSSPSLYGQCKASLYNIAKVYCAQNKTSFKWARIFNLYGPNEKPSRLMPSVIRSALKGEDIKVSRCTKIQDYLYVTDTARGIVDVFESQIEGAVNICSGTPVKLKEIVEKITFLTGFKQKILYGAVKENFNEPFVVGSNERLMNETPFKPKVPLEEGLKLTIDWWRTHNV